MYHYSMLTAASCSASGLYVVFLVLMLYIYIYIYIYMQCGLSTRAYMVIYAYMQGIYAYIEPGKHIYRPYIYIFHVYMCVYMQVACCIYANECNLMQMYAPLHITKSEINIQFANESLKSVCIRLAFETLRRSGFNTPGEGFSLILGHSLFCCKPSLHLCLHGIFKFLDLGHCLGHSGLLGS